MSTDEPLAHHVAELRRLLAEAHETIRLLRGAQDPTPDQQANWTREIKERKRAERRLVAQLAITRTLAEASSLDDAARDVLQILCETLGFRFGALWLPEEGLDCLRCAQLWPSTGTELEAFADACRRHRFERGVGVPGQVWASGRATWIPDVAGLPDCPRARASTEAGLHAALGSPLVLDGRFLGVLELLSAAPLEPDSFMLHMMDDLGRQLGQFVRRRRTEEALRETSDTLRALIDAAPIVIDILDLDGKVKLWNKAAERLFGWTAEEVLGKLLPTVTEATRPLFWEGLRRFRAGESTGMAGVEMPCATKDGRGVTVNVHAAPLRNSRGEVVGVVGLGVDLTHQKRLEEQVVQAQKMESVGRLAGGVAHDFNNLLSVILGYANLALSRGPESARLRDELEEIQRAGERAAALTSQLLAFSRKQILAPEILDLNQLVGNTERLLRRVIGEDIHFAVDLEPALHTTRVDPHQLEQVVMNLAVNARDAMPGGGKLVIETRNVGPSPLEGIAPDGLALEGAVLLRVKDTGVGMNAETRARVFEPFFTTKEKGKGTGLGLATVYGIVRQSGGQIVVESEPGKGTTFSIYLPRVLSPSAAAAASDGSPPTAGRGSELVLVVEDEEQVRKLTRVLLEAQGYQVLEAASGEEALTLCAEPDRSLHLMLTDLVMPGITGRELADRARLLQPRMRVLYMSGYPDESIVHRGVLEPGTRFVQKPFRANELLHRVRATLDEE